MNPCWQKRGIKSRWFITRGLDPRVRPLADAGVVGVVVVVLVLEVPLDIDIDWHRCD
jgi:hypothetical protein